jgi:two-component system, OmpR family, response regulator ChvI
MPSKDIYNSTNDYNDKAFYPNDTGLQGPKTNPLWDSEQITFINYSNYYCVCFVDIVRSTNSTCEITEPNKIRQYYSIFLNTMASIIKRHNGKIIKNSGDSLLYYFPRTMDSENEQAFKDVIDCGLDMIKGNEKINDYYINNGLPQISYRISANYGRVELAVSLNSNNADLFGSSVNLCSKINHLACPNQMIIHKDLYDILMKTIFYDRYIFKSLNTNQDESSDVNWIVYSVDCVEDEIVNSKLVKSQHHYVLSFLNRKNQAKSSPKLLLIDDDDDILFTFKAIFQSEGYKVDTFSDSLEALRHFSYIHPYFYDLIIMDI